MIVLLGLLSLFNYIKSCFPVNCWFQPRWRLLPFWSFWCVWALPSQRPPMKVNLCDLLRPQIHPYGRDILIKCNAGIKCTVLIGCLSSNRIPYKPTGLTYITRMLEWAWHYWIYELKVNSISFEILPDGTNNITACLAHITYSTQDVTAI